MLFPSPYRQLGRRVEEMQPLRLDQRFAAPGRQRCDAQGRHGETQERVFGVQPLASPRIVTSRKFIDGAPMNPATNLLAGLP